LGNLLPVRRDESGRGGALPDIAVFHNLLTDSLSDRARISKKGTAMAWLALKPIRVVV
jgi:hypothetical protein